MNLPSYEKALRLATKLQVLDQRTGSLVPFRLNEEQREVLKAMLTHQRVIVVKGRQIGCSTVIAYFVTLAAIMNPGLPIAIVADEQNKSEGLLLRVKNWLRQLGAKLEKDNVRSAVVMNGANLDALSAMSTSEDEESRVGRSKSYGMIWGSEQAFWRNARAVWASLTSTAGLSAKIVSESTGSPGGELFEELAKRACPIDEITSDYDGYVRLFFGVESHSAYRRDPASLQDDEWEKVKKDFGFVRRDSAAWWEWKRTTDLGGDTQRALREYPVTFEHAFIYPLGGYYRQWLSIPTQVSGSWEAYPPSMDEPTVLAAVATSGLGREPCSMAITGMWSGNIYHTWQSTDYEIPAFAQQVVAAYNTYKPRAVVVETGLETGEQLLKVLAGVRGIPVYPNHTTAAAWLRIRAVLRERIEGRLLGIGQQVQAEIKRVFLDPKSGRVRGEDVATLTKALAVAFEWGALHPEAMPARKPDPNVLYISKRKKKTRVKA